VNASKPRRRVKGQAIFDKILKQLSFMSQSIYEDFFYDQTGNDPVYWAGVYLS
jgi:hypothetical protein